MSLNLFDIVFFVSVFSSWINHHHILIKFPGLLVGLLQITGSKEFYFSVLELGDVAAQLPFPFDYFRHMFFKAIRSKASD